MVIAKEIEILKQTKECISKIAALGVQNIEKMDMAEYKKYNQNIQNLRHIGYVQLADIMDRLIETKDVKLFVQIEFFIKSMEDYVYRGI